MKICFRFRRRKGSREPEGDTPMPVDSRDL